MKSSGEIEEKNFSGCVRFQLGSRFISERGAVAGSKLAAIYTHASARNLNPDGPSALEWKCRAIPRLEGSGVEIHVLMNRDRPFASIL